MPASFVPAIAIAVLLSGLSASRVARALAVSRAVAALLVLAVGIVLAATLSPLPPPASGASPRGCDASRLGPPPPSELLTVSEATLNVALFAPLGATVLLVPRPRQRLLLGAGAAALPVTVEAIQLLAPALGRSCQTADVFDNVAGLFVGLGLAAGWAGIKRLARDASRPVSD